MRGETGLRGSVLHNSTRIISVLYARWVGMGPVGLNCKAMVGKRDCKVLVVMTCREKGRVAEPLYSPPL